MYCQYKVNNYIKVYLHISIIMYSLITSIVQFNQTAKTYHANECLAILAESASETTSEVLKIQNFPRGTCPQTPLVGVCFARTFYIDTSISATNGLSTSYLLPIPLSRGQQQNLASFIPLPCVAYFRLLQFSLGPAHKLLG